jgi:hypothetical protein
MRRDAAENKQQQTIQTTSTIYNIMKGENKDKSLNNARRKRIDVK